MGNTLLFENHPLYTQVMELLTTPICVSLSLNPAIAVVHSVNRGSAREDIQTEASLLQFLIRFVLQYEHEIQYKPYVILRLDHS